MSSWYTDQIATAIRATTFHSPTTFSWFGQLSPRLSSSVRRSITPQNARDYLLFNLQFQLYNDFYCPGRAVPSRLEPSNNQSFGMTPFVGELSAANAGQIYWEGGWEVRRITDAAVVVSRDGLELWTSPGDCLNSEGGAIEPGVRLRLRLPREFLGLSPGYYMALGENELPQHEAEGLVRFYWNLSLQGAAPLVRQVTSALNDANLAFRLKVLNDPTRYTRSDAGVLYIGRRNYRAVAELLEAIYPKIAPQLLPCVPALTKHLAPGLGFAEDPGQRDSFGLHRCRLLADGMIKAYEQHRTSVDDRLHVVQDRFLEAGILLERPFLNPDSADDYAFHPRSGHQWTSPRASTSPIAPVRPNRPEMSESRWLSTAGEIGRRLMDEALWHGERCNWMGSLPAEFTHGRRKAGVTVTYTALGPDLYTGTAGVALFLSELHATTGDQAACRTAVGALRQALSRATAVPGIGLYTGRIGIALVAARVGALLGEEEFIAAAAQLVSRSLDADKSDGEVDLLSGMAGAIVALLWLHDIIDGAPLLGVSAQLGDELLDRADKTDAGYSWNSKEFPRLRNLTGFSHGAAGIGYALLLLSQATGESRYDDAAKRAFDYERFWFDADAGNWPDFRGEPRRHRSRKRVLSFGTYWCHGAPGIAVSRLRAVQLLGDETCKAEAIAALQSTQRTVEDSIRSETGNFSLCHGLSGNAEVLLLGQQVLGSAWPDGLRLARAVAKVGIERYAKRGQNWPCGVASGTTPSLMLGLAGIGRFYLRLYDPTLPSILSPYPEPSAAIRPAAVVNPIQLQHKPL